MKTINLCLVLLISSIIYSQKIKEIDSITHSELEAIHGSKEFKNIVTIQNYKLSDGSWLKSGDTLIVGKPSNSNKLEGGYVQGSSINSHSHIILGTGASAMLGAIYMGNESMTDDKVFITEIKMGRMSKKNPFEVYVEFNKVGGGRFLNIKMLARAPIEKALSSRELINPNAPMTRGDAISKLKEAKDLMDLGLKTKEEFEHLRDELAPTINGSN
ncbi:hypothetical protein OO010_12520 [Flavobacteriaceae bacterium KMM 6898]|nr:hypothetical protein [Flavobacteriaceae bacterium KMM 6898]